MNTKVFTQESNGMLQQVAREIHFAEYKTEILKLRQTVWEETDPELMKQIFKEGFYDEYDDDAFQWGVFNEDGRLIASARLSKHIKLNTIPYNHLLSDIPGLFIELPIASLNRLVVEKKHRDRGISRLLDKVRYEKVAEIDCKSICGMTYGKRGEKLLADGFTVYHSLLLSKYFNNGNEKQQLPLAFYYKRIEKE